MDSQQAMQALLNVIGVTLKHFAVWEKTRQTVEGVDMDEEQLGQLLAILERRCRELTQDVERGLDEVRAVFGRGKPKGRPRLRVEVDQVKEMLESGLKIAEVARRLKCSRQTVYRALGKVPR